jgi:hypothetical protein
MAAKMETSAKTVGRLVRSKGVPHYPSAGRYVLDERAAKLHGPCFLRVSRSLSELPRGDVEKRAAGNC